MLQFIPDVTRASDAGDAEHDLSNVIIKSVQPPIAADHPRGWNTDRSHQRKLRSYTERPTQLALQDL